LNPTRGQPSQLAIAIMFAAWVAVAPFLARARLQPTQVADARMFPPSGLVDCIAASPRMMMVMSVPQTVSCSYHWSLAGQSDGQSDSAQTRPRKPHIASGGMLAQGVSSYPFSPVMSLGLPRTPSSRKEFRQVLYCRFRPSPNSVINVSPPQCFRCIVAI